MEAAKILVVDDEKEICEVTRIFLARKKYNVFTAYNGAEALAIVAREHPQLVLLDLRLGSESGLDVLKKIKEIQPDAKVIMITALDDASSAQEAQELGADDYIAKPFTASFLDELVSKKLA